jgi:hypothetical protein
MTKTQISTEYRVQFFVFENDYLIWEANFTAYAPQDVENLVSACSAFYSGDDCQCWINGEKVVLEGDWGLL